VTLYYDADCAFCTRVGLASQDRLRGVEVVPMQSVDLAGLGIDPTRAWREVPFRSTNGEVSYGSDAMANALVASGGLHALAGRVMLVWPVSILARLVYLVVAKYRYKLPGGTAACALPSDPDAR